MSARLGAKVSTDVGLVDTEVKDQGAQVCINL